MALNTFLDFSTTAASNVDVAGIGIQGANAVSNFDNAFRQLMAILRRDLDNGMVLTGKSANYTAVANDNNAFIRFSAAATLSLTAAATLGVDWHCWVMADGGAVIIDPNGAETINGGATITIPDGYSTLVICDGTNFRALEDYATVSVDLAAKLDAVQASVDVASATTTDIGAAASQNVRITGTTTITGLGTVAAGTFRRVRFAGALTLTHNGTSLILPGAANILTVAGDVAEFISEGSGNWRCVDYSPPRVVTGTTTNDSAGAGQVGEYVEGSLSFGSATSLVSSTPKTVTSISLTAGDWDVSGLVQFTSGGATTSTLMEGAITTAPNTNTTATVCANARLNSTALGTNPGHWLPIGPTRISVGATTTVYLCANSQFSSSTMSAYGAIRARRVR